MVKPPALPPTDDEPLAVDAALVGQPGGGRAAVVDVDDSPRAIELAAVGPAVATAAAVVDVDDGEAPAGPELLGQRERRVGRRRRTTVAQHDERRPLAGQALKAGLAGA